jgi:hypothetical protein
MKSSAATLITAQCDGIAMNAASLNQPLVICTSGSLSLGELLDIGEVYCVAPTGGILAFRSLAEGQYVTILGVARTFSYLIVAPYESGVPLVSQ